MFVAAAAPLFSQPSGGPYGPVPQTYTVSAGAAQVYYVAPDGQPSASGKSLQEPTSLAAAIERASTGAVIVLRGGTYRTGNLQLNQGVTFQPHADETPILKGSQVVKEWKAQDNGVWRATWKTLFPMKPAEWWRRERSGRKTPLYRFNNDMVFVDGRMLKAVGWEGEVDENSFYIDYEASQVYIGVDPSKHQIEITAFDNALTRVTGNVHGRPSDKKGFIMRGLAIMQYAYRGIEIEGTNPEAPADPATFGKDVVGTTLEHVTISHCSRVAGYFRGDNMVFRNCLISDTRTEGLFILSSADVLLERNIFRRNNVDNIHGYYPAAVKIFNQCYRAVVRDNLVVEQTNSNGIWWDVGNVDAVFVNNWVQDAEDGFFFEISKGAVCAGNVFVNCHKGVRSLNASNVHVYNNTFFNTVASFERTERSAVGDHFDWHPASGPAVNEREGHVFVNNLLVADETYDRELVRFEQVKGLCGKLTQPQTRQFDGNVYLRRGASPQHSLIYWSPSNGPDCTTVYTELESFRREQSSFETKSLYQPNVLQSVFRSVELKNFEPLRPVPATVAIPDAVRKATGWTGSGQLTVGAYQGK